MTTKQRVQISNNGVKTNATDLGQKYYFTTTFRTENSLWGSVGMSLPTPN